MIKNYSTNLEDIVIKELKKAKKSIKVAVAWINFNLYGSTFEELLSRGVKIKILLNDDFNNRRYINDIQSLNSCGAKIRLVDFGGTMHHKFCIIDKRICMFGSFNWTHSANVRNIEDLTICDEVSLVNDYLTEFNALWELHKSDIKMLRHPTTCPICETPFINILFMEQEGDYQTKISVMQQCECEQKIVSTDYYDISVYMGYESVIHQFEDYIAEAEQCGDQDEYARLIEEQNFAISDYLSSVRNNRMGLPIIHAVGVKAWEWFNKHEGGWYYKIIWRERGTEQYVNDRYEIMF